MASEAEVEAATKDAELAALRAENASLTQQAGNVLARIHRDGGHYIVQHGWDKACADADAIVCDLQTRNSNLLEDLNKRIVAHGKMSAAIVALEGENAKLRERAEGLAEEVCSLRLLAMEVRSFLGLVDAVPQSSSPYVEALRSLIVRADIRRKATDAAGWLEGKP